MPELNSSIGAVVISLGTTSQSGTPTGSVTPVIPVGIALGLTGSLATTTPKSGSSETGITAIAGILGAAVMIGWIKRN